MNNTVTAVTEQNFATEVIEASAQVPVVVDFWAPWCGPCRQLSPLLEQMVQRFGSDVRVVKLNVDEAPRLAQEFRVQGIPAVKAFRNGRVVSEFVGLQPAPAIEQFFAALAPSEADRLVAQAARQPGEASDLLGRAVAADPSHAGALLALAQMAREEGRTADAEALLQRVPHEPEAQRLLAALRLENGNAPAASLETLARQAEHSGAAKMIYARALVAQQRHAEAVDVLLAAVTEPAARDEARALLLDVFRVLGDDHPITRSARPRLASALFA